MMTNNLQTNAGLARQFIVALKKAKITPCYISYYLPVSRQSVSNWVHSAFEVHPDHAERVTLVMAALRQAVADGQLPNSDTREVHSVLTRYGVEADPSKAKR